MVCCIPVRYILACLIFTGTLLNYATRVTINIAILEMTRNASELCNGTSSVISPYDGEEILCWSNWDQGLVKAAFYYGYPLTQLIGGWMAQRLGTKWVFGGQNALAACLTILTPFASRAHVWVVIALRFLMGLIEGVTYPCLPPMITLWVPKLERARFVSFTYLGGAFGSAFCFPIAGLILEWGGWESVFYLFGSISIIWSIIWFFYVTDDPTNHGSISLEEKTYILEHRGGETSDAEIQGEEKKTPMKEMIFNPTVWIIMLCDFANIWGILVMINEGPNFIDKILKRSISGNGFLSAAPHVWTVVAGQIFGFTSDLILKKHILPKGILRKIMHSFGFLFPAAGIGLLGYILDDWKISVAIMTVGYGFRGATYSGHTLSPLDLTPTYSGPMYGLCNGFGAVSGLIVPILATALTANDPTDISGWRTLFLTTVGLYVVTWFLYVAFVKIKPLPFDDQSEEKLKNQKYKEIKE